MHYNLRGCCARSGLLQQKNVIQRGTSGSLRKSTGFREPPHTKRGVLHTEVGGESYEKRHF